jgi:hypothetical protein
LNKRKLLIVLALALSFLLTVYLISSLSAIEPGVKEFSASGTTQNWLVTMPTTIPASKQSLPPLLGILAPKDTVKELNELPSAAENDIIAGVLDIGAFEKQGFSVSKVQVTNTHWSNNMSNDCVLVFDLTTVSDPLTTADVLAVIIAGAVTLGVILFAITAWNAGAALWLIGAVSGAVFVIALIVVLAVLVSNGATTFSSGSPLSDSMGK